jgi:hypothetical protein
MMFQTSGSSRVTYGYLGDLENPPETNDRVDEIHGFEAACLKELTRLPLVKKQMHRVAEVQTTKAEDWEDGMYFADYFCCLADNAL